MTDVIGPHAARDLPKWLVGNYFASLDNPFHRPIFMYLALLERALTSLREYQYTMLSPERLRNIRDVIYDVDLHEVEGDFIETGIWRGGACIYAMGACEAFQNERRVFCADSFAGLPPPDPRYPQDVGDDHYKDSSLAVSMFEVRDNFRDFDLLSDKVVFLKGWFDQSLQLLEKDQKFAVIRLDGDMYGSTMDALLNLYDRLSIGGYCIIDDFGAVAGCQKAVNQFRRDRDITEQMFNIDDVGIFWRKEK